MLGNSFLCSSERQRAKDEEIMDTNLWIKPINQRNFSCSLSRTRIVVDMRVAKWKEYIL